MNNSELKQIIKECVQEINEDTYINENYDSDYLTESSLEKIGLSKDDLTNTQKVKEKNR